MNSICVQSSDVKVLIAFSSVGHIGVALLCGLRGTLYGQKVFFIIMFGHGIRSSIIFFYRYLFYKISSTRSLILNKSLKRKASILIIFWCVSCLGILGGPPSANL